jgi:preprotein translocase subunit SecG
MLLNILLVILVLDCVALTAVILMQRSEGGALGMGGGPQGMFTARGAGDLLTRMTSILTTVFFVLSLGITLMAGHSRQNASLTQRLKVNPIDISALAASSAPAPAASSAPAAPPLPGAIPPLPSAAPLPTVASQAPRPGPAAPPRLRPQLRPSAPPLAAAPGALKTTLPSIAKPTPLIVPPPATAAPAGPAGQAPSGQ